MAAVSGRIAVHREEGTAGTKSASVTEKQRRADLSASLQKLKDRIPGSESLSNRQQVIEAGVAYIDSLRYTIHLLEFDKRMLQSEKKWLMEQSTRPDFTIGRGGPASSSDTRPISSPISDNHLHKRDHLTSKELPLGNLENMRVLYTCTDPYLQRIQILGHIKLPQMLCEMRCRDRHGVLYEAMDAIKAYDFLSINKCMQEYDTEKDQLIQIFLLDIVENFNSTQVEQLGEDIVKSLFSPANIAPGVKRKKN